MQKRGMARWLGVQHRLEEKRQKPPKSFEEPSKNLRNITITSPLPHASRTLAAGWACRSRTMGAWGIGGVETLA